MNPNETEEAQVPMPKIIFTNQPKLSEHEIDQARNERRLGLVPEIEKYISNYPLFKDKEVKVFFAQKGVSSLVCILETPENKFVLKIPLSSKPKYEGAFLNAWESAGVEVPHVIEEGSIGGFGYILMEHIDAKSLIEFYKQEGLIKEKVFAQMGSTLRQMHVAEGNGYGLVVAGKGEFDSFESWLFKDDGIKKKFDYVKENKLLSGEDHGSIEEACQILVEHVRKDPRSTYCHNDFAPENIFATSPITVFDPDPVFNHPYIDLARTIVIGISRCGPEAASQITEGYFKDEKYDKKALQAAILVEAYMKFRYWNETNQSKRLTRLKSYLSQTKNNLS